MRTGLLLTQQPAVPAAAVVSAAAAAAAASRSALSSRFGRWRRHWRICGGRGALRRGLQQPRAGWCVRVLCGVFCGRQVLSAWGVVWVMLTVSVVLLTSLVVVVRLTQPWVDNLGVCEGLGFEWLTVLAVWFSCDELPGSFPLPWQATFANHRSHTYKTEYNTTTHDSTRVHTPLMHTGDMAWQAIHPGVAGGKRPT